MMKNVTNLISMFNIKAGCNIKPGRELINTKILLSLLMIFILMDFNLFAQSNMNKNDQSVDKQVKIKIDKIIKKTTVKAQTKDIKTKDKKAKDKKNIEIIKTEPAKSKKADLKKKEYEKEEKLVKFIEKSINFGIHKERKEAINRILLITNKELKARLEKKLVNIIKEEIDSDVKIKAITIAGELKLEMAVPEIEKLLNHESMDVRISAVYAIKIIGDKSAKNSLIIELKKQKFDKHTTLTEALIDTLGEFKAVELQEYAENVIKNDKTNGNIRELFVLFLGKLGSKKSSDFLIKLLKDDEEEKGIRSYAANSLAHLQIKEAAKDIDEIIKQIDSYSFKKKKKYYNLYIYCIAALAKLGDERAIPRLINSLRSDNAVVRLKTINLLKDFKDKRTIDILKYKRDHDPSLRVRNAAKKALAKYDEEADQKDKKENFEKKIKPPGNIIKQNK